LFGVRPIKGTQSAKKKSERPSSSRSHHPFDQKIAIGTEKVKKKREYERTSSVRQNVDMEPAVAVVQWWGKEIKSAVLQHIKKQIVHASAEDPAGAGTKGGEKVGTQKLK